MRDAIVLNGRFRVTDAGQVYKHTAFGYESATIGHLSRKTGYQIVTYYADGKQCTAYVHRLMAEAFVPKVCTHSIARYMDAPAQADHDARIAKRNGGKLPRFYVS